MKTGIKYIFIIFAISTILTVLINQITDISASTRKVEKLAIEKLEKNNAAYTCILSTKKTNYRLGEKPQLQVEIINKTDSSVLFVGSLDGSAVGWRLPFCSFSVKHQVFGDISKKFRFCATVNPIRTRDFVEILPNARFDPYANNDGQVFFSSPKIDASQFWLPGTYTLQFHYRTFKEREPYIDGKSFDKLWLLVPKLVLESNTITIKYKI